MSGAYVHFVRPKWYTEALLAIGINYVKMFFHHLWKKKIKNNQIVLHIKTETAKETILFHQHKSLITMAKLHELDFESLCLTPNNYYLFAEPQRALQEKIFSWSAIWNGSLEGLENTGRSRSDGGDLRAQDNQQWTDT